MYEVEHIINPGSFVVGAVSKFCVQAAVEDAWLCVFASAQLERVERFGAWLAPVQFAFRIVGLARIVTGYSFGVSELCRPRQALSFFFVLSSAVDS